MCKVHLWDWTCYLLGWRWVHGSHSNWYKDDKPIDSKVRMTLIRTQKLLHISIHDQDVLWSFMKQEKRRENVLNMPVEFLKYDTFWPKIQFHQDSPRGRIVMNHSFKWRCFYSGNDKFFVIITFSMQGRGWSLHRMKVGVVERSILCMMWAGIDNLSVV